MFNLKELPMFKKLDNLSISKRLFSGFAILSILLLGVAFAGGWGVGSVTDHTVEMLDGVAIAAEHTARARANAIGMRQYEKDMFLNIANAEKVDDYLKKWEKQKVSFIARIKSFDDVAPPEDDSAIKEIRDNLDAYAESIMLVYGKIKSGEVTTAAQANKVITPFKKYGRALMATTKVQATEHNEEMHDQKELLEGKAATVKWILLGCILAALALAVWLSVFISRSITNPVRQITDIANELAKGNFNQTLDMERQDEIGDLADAFREMITAEKALAAAAEKVGDGDLSVMIELRSDGDVMAKALDNMIASLKRAEMMQKRSSRMTN